MPRAASSLPVPDSPSHEHRDVLLRGGLEHGERGAHRSRVTEQPAEVRARDNGIASSPSSGVSSSFVSPASMMALSCR